MNSSEDQFNIHFNYGSFLPLFLFVIGIYIIYLFLIEKFSQGIFTMIFALVVYAINNIILNVEGFTTIFNEYLEDMATFTAFGLSTIVFGLMFYKDSDPILLAVLMFYAVSLILALGRNWILKVKNSIGYPIPLNGIFFPMLFYIYVFYLQNPGITIFVFYYILISILLLSSYNFLGYEEKKTFGVKEDAKKKIKIEHLFKKPRIKKDEELDLDFMDNTKTKKKKDEELNLDFMDNTKTKKKNKKKFNFFSFLFKKNKEKKKDKDLGLEYLDAAIKKNKQRDSELDLEFM